MPTYDYECQECNHRFEQFQRITEDPVRVCPSCGKRKVRRLISTGAGLIFKGSGFYVTDSKSSGAAAAPAKTDAKPAATKSESGGRA
jgi:putative FmdB family regulatory protein